MARVHVCIILGLSCVNPAFGEQPCSSELAGKTACVAGELMLCNREFDPGLHAFKYEWHGINNTGQPFDIYYDAMYKKIPGLTPATCGDMTVAPSKATPVPAGSSAKSVEAARPRGSRDVLQNKEGGNALQDKGVLGFLFGGLFLALSVVLFFIKRKDPAIGCAKYRSNKCNKAYPRGCKYPHCEELKR